jgi:dipeptidyl aminopeptidase/acylaminoacyl peptidase
MEHLFACNLSAGEGRDLTPFPGVKAVLIGREPKKPEEVLITLNRRGKTVFDVWSVNLSNGALTPVMQNPGDIVQWIVTPSLQVRAAVAKGADGSGELRLLTRQHTWRTLYSWKVTDTVDVIGLSEEEKELYLKSNVDTDTATLYALEIRTGRWRRIFSDPHADLGGIEMHPRTRAVRAVVCYRLKPRWQVLDKSIAKDFHALANVTLDSLAGIASDLTDKHWIVAFQSDTNALSYYLWDRRQQKATYLFSSWPGLQQYALAPMRAFELKARDGLSLPSYLTLPLGIEPEGLPLVLLVHGGPGDRDWWGYAWVTQWLANRGYAVLEVNYRGSGGFGKAFMNAAYREFAGKMHDDLIDGVKWAIKEGIADPKRIAIMGGSYGGYATLVGLTFTPDVFACGVETFGFSNLRTFIESAPAYWKPYLPGYWYKLVGNPEVPADRLDMEKRSPLFHIESIKAPLLIGQGANDPRVKKQESDQMVAAMRKGGKQVDYIVFPDEGHGFARPENNRCFNAAAEQFLAAHLGGRFEPAAESELADKFRQ